MSKDDFFIGWAETPEVDRRFMLGAGLSIITGTTAVGIGISARQRPVGSGTWDMGEIREWRGIATAEPYGMIRTLDLDGTERNRLARVPGQVRSQRQDRARWPTNPSWSKDLSFIGGHHAMIAVIDGLDWIREDPDGSIDGLAFPQPEPIMDVSLNGEIMDSKCWFGGDAPGAREDPQILRQPVHPRRTTARPFYVRDMKDQTALMIMTSGGYGHNKDLLPFVAESVSITGQLQRFGDLFLLDAPVSAITRL